MISTLIGIEEGKIKSTDNPITNYLPEFKTKPGFEKITIKNPLQHTSGIKFSDQEFNIISDNKFYWGHKKRDDSVNY
jgi:CubicO group peptidase (beta-lactamase class C family)